MTEQGGPVCRAQCHADGNLLYDGNQVYTYDAWNRMTSVAHAYVDSTGVVQHGQVFAQYGYDGENRRISRVISDTGSWDGTSDYYYTGQQQIEVRNGSGWVLKQNVWGLRYIDGLCQIAINSKPDQQTTCDQTYYAMQDANYDVLGIVNSSGALVERYSYTAYGRRQVYYSPGTNDPGCNAPIQTSQRVQTDVGTMPYGLCSFGHQGLMHDEATGLVYNRSRYLNPELGRFMSEDPLGYVDGANIYQYERERTVDAGDPLGNFSFAMSVGYRRSFTLAAGPTPVPGAVWIVYVSISVRAYRCKCRDRQENWGEASISVTAKIQWGGKYRHLARAKNPRGSKYIDRTTKRYAKGPKRGDTRGIWRGPGSLGACPPEGVHLFAYGFLKFAAGAYWGAQATITFPILPHFAKPRWSLTSGTGIYGVSVSAGATGGGTVDEPLGHLVSL